MDLYSSCSSTNSSIDSVPILPLHKTTNGLKHIRRQEMLKIYSCQDNRELKTIPGDYLVNLMRECLECANLSSKLKVATLDNLKYKTYSGLLNTFCLLHNSIRVLS